MIITPHMLVGAAIGAHCDNITRRIQMRLLNIL